MKLHAEGVGQLSLEDAALSDVPGPAAATIGRLVRAGEEWTVQEPREVAVSPGTPPLIAVPLGLRRGRHSPHRVSRGGAAGGEGRESPTVSAEVAGQSRVVRESGGSGTRGLHVNADNFAAFPQRMFFPEKPAE